MLVISEANLQRQIEDKNGTLQRPRYNRGLVISEVVISEVHCNNNKGHLYSAFPGCPLAQGALQYNIKHIKTFDMIRIHKISSPTYYK